MYDGSFSSFSSREIIADSKFTFYKAQTRKREKDKDREREKDEREN